MYSALGEGGREGVLCTGEGREGAQCTLEKGVYFVQVEKKGCTM